MYIYLPIAEVSVNAFLLLGLGGMVGILSGMFGVGGGFLMTPLLFFIGIPPAVAVATEANQIVASSFSGVLAHVKRKTVDFKMGGVLLIGGLVGAALGVVVFNYLKSLGQVDLLVKLCYVLFLGVVGSLMFAESLRALRKSKQVTVAKPRKKRGLVHALPFKMRFRVSGLYISIIPPIVVGVAVGVLAAIMGVGRWFRDGSGDDLPAGYANKSCGGHIAVSDHFRDGVYHYAARHHQLHGGYGAGGIALDRRGDRRTIRNDDWRQAQSRAAAHPSCAHGATCLRQAGV